MTPNPNITDQQRAEFLGKLKRSDLIVSSWESDFITDFLAVVNSAGWFTDGRRVAADKMRMKYGREPEIKMPYPVSTAVRSPIAPASATGCEYLVKLDGDLQRCNAEAIWVTGRGFRYCQGCAELVQENLRRGGKVLNLRRIE